MTDDKVKKILIVDDEENIRKMLEFVVKEMGHEVAMASNGQEAFRYATQGDFDLMLLDIMMPGWNGVESIKGLNFINQRPKIVVISGYISDELREELQDIPMVVKYVPKPFKIDEIRTIIDTYAK